MDPLPSTTAFDALERTLQTEKGIDQADVVIAAYELAVVEQAVAPAAPEGFVDPRGVQAPDAAATPRADKPPPFATQILPGGNEAYLETELHTWRGQPDSSPELIAFVVPGSDEVRRRSDADTLRSTESASGLACGQNRREVSRNRCIHVGDKLYVVVSAGSDWLTCQPVVTMLRS